jgi:hypothetical protein
MAEMLLMTVVPPLPPPLIMPCRPWLQHRELRAGAD